MPRRRAVKSRSRPRPWRVGLAVGRHPCMSKVLFTSAARRTALRRAFMTRGSRRGSPDLRLLRLERVDPCAASRRPAAPAPMAAAARKKETGQNLRAAVNMIAAYHSTRGSRHVVSRRIGIGSWEFDFHWIWDLEVVGCEFGSWDLINPEDLPRFKIPFGSRPFFTAASRNLVGAELDRQKRASRALPCSP